jgi:hypothetical protein
VLELFSLFPLKKILGARLAFSWSRSDAGGASGTSSLVLSRRLHGSFARGILAGKERARMSLFRFSDRVAAYK